MVRGPIEATAGVRLNDFGFPPGNARRAFAPRARLRVRPLAPVSLHAAPAVSHQAPLPRDPTGDFGNPDLELERTTQLVVGAALELPALFLEGDFFRNRLANGIMGSGGTVEREGEIVWENLRNGETGIAQGVELLV